MQVRPKHTLPVSHETDADFPMNLKTQPRVYWTNFMLQNLHEYHWENTPHCAISGTQRLLLLRNQHPRNQCDWSTKIFESIMNSSGAKFAYREPRLEVFKDLERQEGNRRAFICDKCTNHRLARPATRAKCQRFLQPRLRSQSAAPFKAWRKHSYRQSQSPTSS